MSVLIDPYMFELSSEQEILDNISFFMKIIKITTYKEKNRRVPIAIYRGMVEKMQRREVQPFPIQITQIQDRDLKASINQLNKLFGNALIRSIESIDIDECGGNQDFYVRNDAEMIEDEHYFELLSTLLVPCYSRSTDLDSRILTGNKEQGKQIGDAFELVCDCENSNYNRHCIFVSVDDLISDKDKVIEELKRKRKQGEIIVNNDVSTIIGNHHNHIQANRKKFSKLDDLSSRNKGVLCLLKELGLSRVIFGEFTPNGARAVGTMSIQEATPKETQDIVTVRFTAETQMVIETDLYFPKGIGELLEKYFKSEQLTYQEVKNLIEKTH